MHNNGDGVQYTYACLEYQIMKFTSKYRDHAKACVTFYDFLTLIFGVIKVINFCPLLLCHGNANNRNMTVTKHESGGIISHCTQTA